MSAGPSGASSARSPRAAPRRWAATSRPARIAAHRASPTTRAAIGIARSVRARRASNGCRIARPNCCRFPISTSCSRCRRRSRRSLSRTRPAVYAILFKSAIEATTTLAANPRRLGAKIGGLAILPTWGQALTRHPHVHCVVPGGGLSLDGSRWIAGRPNFFLAVKPLSRLFRRLFLERLQAAFDAKDLGFFGDLAALADPAAFAAHLAAVRRVDWIVYAKRPFGGPAQVLAYLGRYTHRVAIANSRIKACDDDHVAFTWKDYRQGGVVKTMRLKPDEFIRRFLLHTLPDRFYRIRHFGFLANRHRTERLALCRSRLVQAADAKQEATTPEPSDRAGVAPPPCPECGGVMRFVGRLPRSGRSPRSGDASPFRCDTS